MDVERNSSIGGEGDDIDIDYLSMFSSVPESHDKFIQRMKSKSIQTKSLRLPECFCQIFVNAKLSPGLIKIQTLAGSNTFRLTIHNKPRDDQIGDSFVHVVINHSADEIHIPIGCFEHHFKDCHKSGCLTIKGGYNQSVAPREITSLPGARATTDCQDRSLRLRISVYKPNGIEAILPLNENEICGVLEEEDDGDDDADEEEVDDEEVEEDAVIVGNLHLLQPGTSRSVQRSRSYNVSVEAAEDGVVTFERKKKTLKMRYFKAEVRSYRIRKTKAVDDRFVLDGWREFMDEYGIGKNERCSFSYYTSPRFLVVRKTSCY
ncbi:hypothetical protein E3N88_23065 [Mikania micrantha]|uniref:TF-B3 domain-containing protein n=1 Tax=Mikania micrantha TaxID=192012 RepID=A0A5N6NCG1_9ASTR|nr:hypothetical protein E3N88_23065 [Mikania micrantha]